MEAIFLQPFFNEKIWGGNQLKTEFNFDLPSDKVGEAWVASAHPNGLSKVSSPTKYQGLTLKDLYRDYRELFGPDQPDVFPLLVKILDAREDLSVQVHPDDAYAHAHEGPHEYGKNECWYVIAADPGAKIIYGHHAESQKAFQEYVDHDNFEGLFREIPVQAGDFFDVPAGTIHAIGAGVMILETQQSSDTTYRVYDYHRTDDQGNTRELHLKEAADVTIYPHQDSPFTQVNNHWQTDTFDQLVSHSFFEVRIAKVEEKLQAKLANKYYIVTVVDGTGQFRLNDKCYQVAKGNSFILPYGEKEVELIGKMELIFSSTNE